jgi:peptidoglycan-associated lipoprotein
VNKKSVFLSALYFALGCLLLTGCPPKKKLPIEEKPPVEETKKGDETATALKPGEFDITQDWTEVPALQNVRFDYDSASLNDNARSILKINVGILKKLPKSVTVRVEGHCDDRGTVEYNIALGQRRADAVRSYYATAGLSKSRLETVSFGEERPLCNEETDACWATNRRGTTKVKNNETIRITPEQLK